MLVPLLRFSNFCDAPAGRQTSPTRLLREQYGLIALRQELKTRKGGKKLAMPGDIPSHQPPPCAPPPRQKAREIHPPT